MFKFMKRANRAGKRTEQHSKTITQIFILAGSLDKELLNRAIATSAPKAHENQEAWRAWKRGVALRELIKTLD